VLSQMTLPPSGAAVAATGSKRIEARSESTMAAHDKEQTEQSFEIDISSSSRRPKTKLRADVNAALKEATEGFEAAHKLSVKVSGEAQGGLFDLGAAWPWIVTVAGPALGGLLYKAGEEAFKELGKEGAQSFYEFLKEALRKRNFTIGPPKDLRLFPDPDHELASRIPPAPAKVKGTKAKRKPVARRKSKKSK
jgi:hypothetical protein